MSPNHLAHKGRRRGGKLRRWGERRSPRAGVAARSRAVRASCLPTLWSVRGVRRWKWGHRRRSEARPLDGDHTKPGPDRTKGPHTPWEEPWWSAGRRAVRLKDGAAPGRRFAKSELPAMRGGSALRLPAFHFPFSSLRAERSNPGREFGFWIFRRYRSSQ